MLEFLTERLDEYKYMGYTFTDYLIRLVIPFTAMGIASILVGFLFSDLFGNIRYLLYALSGLLIAVGVLYPKIWASTRKKELEQNLHLFITHLGVLATTGIERSKIFKIMAQKEDEYGPLAEVADQLDTLVNTWNQSLEDACRHVAENIPSKTISDFLERMAHSTEAGQDIKQFLMEEQEVLMDDYEAMYEDSLDAVMEIRDLFTSILLAVVFLIVFSILIPLISGMSPLLLLGIATAVFIGSETGFLLATEFILPEDPIWSSLDYITSKDRKIGKGEIFAIAGFIALAVFSALQLLFNIPFSSNPLPIEFYIGVPFTPLVVPGVLTWLEERKIIDRDENFSSFIRSLGSIASARQSTSSRVLGELKEKDFSELTQSIENLYKRLQTRIDRDMAWDIFSAETGSFLIRKFSDMYFEGIDNGGDAKRMSEIISNNFKRVLRVRKERYSRAGNIMGLIYGMTGGVIIAIFIGFYLATKMVDIVGSAMTGRLSEIFSLGVYDIPGTHFLLLIVVVLNALIGALFIRSARGSHELLSYTHMGILVWMGIFLGSLAKIGLGLFLSV